MNTQLTNTAGLCEDLLKVLAYKQFNDEDFFFCNGLPYEGTEEDKQQEFNDEMEGNEDEYEKIEFETWVQENCTEITDEVDSNNEYENHKILTDEEADELWEESLDSYIEEIILPEIPESYRNYFDEKGWKSDAKMDGRGHSINTYDGNENEETILGETFYIYRVN